MNEEASNRFILEPTSCPCCDSTLEKVNDQLFCRNSICPAQVLKRVEHFTKVLGIKGLGPKTIEKLQIQEITELFYLDRDEVISVLGEKIADKLLDEIERSKVATLATVLESFAIPLFGKTASKKLSAVVSSIEDINEDTCKKAGLGNKVTENVLYWLETEYGELKEFLPFTFSEEVVNTNESARRVCITGKLKSYKKKADAENDLIAAGYILVDSVTKSTDFLVDESGIKSSKRDKAEQYGVIIINDINDILKGK